MIYSFTSFRIIPYSVQFPVLNITWRKNKQIKQEISSFPFSDCNFYVQDVRSVLSGTKTTKSPGPNNISRRLLKHCADQLSGVFLLPFRQQRVPRV